MIHKAKNFTLYFGDAKDAISKEIDCIPSNQPLVAHAKFAPIARSIAAHHLAFLNQTHSKDGRVITHQIPSFNQDGDFLITAQKNIGIGVMTADCLPIIFYDKKHHAAAVAHAGWRGSALRIAQEVVAKMHQEIGTTVHDLHIFLGPSANVCCYTVNEDFPQQVKNLSENSNLKLYASPEMKRLLNSADASLEANGFKIDSNFAHAYGLIKTTDNKTHFDLPLFNILQLKELGISLDAISRAYNFCTICDHRFFSYRRQGQEACRQMSIISLN